MLDDPEFHVPVVQLANRGLGQLHRAWAKWNATFRRWLSCFVRLAGGWAEHTALHMSSGAVKALAVLTIVRRSCVGR